MRIKGNDYNLMEIAGAFGDLGTLIPFVAGYITLSRMDPLGILVSMGALMIMAGLYYRTPIPVQPMKAIGAAAIAGGASVTHGMIWGAGLLTGAFWLVMGLTGLITWIEKITTKPVVRGIMLGLGLNFIIQALGMMKAEPGVSIAAFAMTLLLMKSKKIPAILVLLIFGIIISFIMNPGLVDEFRAISVRFRLPGLSIPHLGLREMAAGFVLLGIPQIPLTLGNAVIGTVAENNQLFAEKTTTTRTIATSHGIMNLLSGVAGGIPVCHGAGGMAGHIRFGARTGGSLVILGAILLIMGLFFSDSVSLIFKVFPPSILGVILFFAGVQLALAVKDIKLKRQNLAVLVITAGISMWNMGVAYITGLALYYMVRKKWIEF